MIGNMNHGRKGRSMWRCSAITTWVDVLGELSAWSSGWRWVSTERLLVQCLTNFSSYCTILMCTLMKHCLLYYSGWFYFYFFASTCRRLVDHLRKHCCSSATAFAWCLWSAGSRGRSSGRSWPGGPAGSRRTAARACLRGPRTAPQTAFDTAQWHISEWGFCFRSYGGEQ